MPRIKCVGWRRGVVLRNMRSAGSTGCSCSRSRRLSSGRGEPWELLTLSITKGSGVCGLAEWLDTETQQEQMSLPGFPFLRL